uniref:DUF5717 family protein n=1 Tax=Eubacterium cellulosolvens TaxID=29322 RepID=UPI000486F591|nr:DUF5717 family protein [[Eubacterium] cellulosolvens]
MSRQEGTKTAGFTYDLPELVPSETEIRLRVQEGTRRRTSIRLKASDGSAIRGSVYTDEQRIDIERAAFEGEDCDIRFSASAVGLKAGDCAEGAIVVSCNLSETEIPVRIECTGTAVDEFPEDVHTLDDFSRLCQKSLREGFRLYTSPSFARILNGNNRKYLALYRGMSANPVTYQHLEEFLVTTGKKGPIEITLDRQEKAVYHLDVSQKDTLYVYRNTWGYVRLEVETVGDFLEVEKQVITTEDFIGKVYGLSYIVHRDRIGEGRSYGRIMIRSVHQTLEYLVEASAKEDSQILPSVVRNRKISWLLRDYLNLRLHILDFHSWQESSSMTLREMTEEAPNDTLSLLYSAYLHYTMEDTAKTIESLWPIKEGEVELVSTEEKGAYLVLAKAVNLLPEERMDVLADLRRYYRSRPESYLLLYLIHREMGDDDYNPADRMQELEDCFQAGCSSPFLYLDAWELLKKEEALLRRLSPFMIHVLSFGQRYSELTEGLLQRTAFLSDNAKQFDRAVYRLLTRGYEKYPNSDVLEAICKMQIKSNPVNPAYFAWYERAVEKDIRITRLYEYYMETYGKAAAEEIPLAVRMYFATNDTLGEKKKALLYANIVLHMEEDERMYLNYVKKIHEFARNALRHGRINENYAVLYQRFFRNPTDSETAKLLADVIFSRRVEVSDPKIRRVIVTHTAMKNEEAAVVVDGTAYPRVYSEDAQILFEDVHHRRFASTISYRIAEPSQLQNLAKTCLEFGINHAGAQLYVCHEKAFRMEVNSHTAAVYRAAVRNEAFTDEYRDVIRRKLLDYDLAHPDLEVLPDTLPVDELADYARADKAGTAKLLIREGRYGDAFRVVAEFGWEGLPAGLLLELATRLIQSGDYAGDDALVRLAVHVFLKGEYNDNVLLFLAGNYRGPVATLAGIWKTMYKAGLGSTKLAERIMMQSVQTQQYPGMEEELLSDYVRKSGKPEVTAAFLAYLADHYFLGDREAGDSIFGIMEQQIRNKELDFAICKLALLKYYAGQEELTEEQTLLARQMLEQMDDRGLRFDFYTRLPKELTQAYQIDDKVFVQEQYAKNARVVLHYRLTEKNGTEGKWIAEPMRNVYKGIFVREFLLFYGETLTYYLSVMKDGKIENTDSYQVTLADMDTEGVTKYRLLNRLLEAEDKGEQGAFSQACRQYRMQTKYVDTFLKLFDTVDGRRDDGSVTSERDLK